jgi:hypothetical protein
MYAVCFCMSFRTSSNLVTDIISTFWFNLTIVAHLYHTYIYIYIYIYIYTYTYTVRPESGWALRLRYVDLVVSIEVAVEVCCSFAVFSC